MAAPTLLDGIRRAVRELTLPSALILGVVVALKVTYGSLEAGFAYLGLMALLLLGIYTSAKYWNVRYTAGFVVAGLVLWFGVPEFMPNLIPSTFVTVGHVLPLVILVGLALMIRDKL